MKRWVWLIAVTLMSLPLAGGDAIGGGTRKDADEGADCDIHFDTGSGQFVASGALGTVQAEPHSLVEKSIGCTIDIVPGHAMVTCQAQSESSPVPQLICTSEDPLLISMVAASMNSDSFITFMTPTINSANKGTCSHITIENSSLYNVKVPYSP